MGTFRGRAGYVDAWVYIDIDIDTFEALSGLETETAQDGSKAVLTPSGRLRIEDGDWVVRFSNSYCVLGDRAFGLLFVSVSGIVLADPPVAAPVPLPPPRPFSYDTDAPVRGWTVGDDLPNEGPTPRRTRHDYQPQNDPRSDDFVPSPAESLPRPKRSIFVRPPPDPFAELDQECLPQPEPSRWDNIV